MIEDSVKAAEALPYGIPEPDNGPVDSVEALKQRISRLEDAVAALQDTRPLEDRLVERVVERVAAPGVVSAEAKATTRRRGRSFGVVRREDDVALPAAVPVQAPSPAPPPQPLPGRSAWFVLDLWGELRTIGRMYVDRGYRMRWLARLTPVVVLVGMWLSWYFLDGHLFFIGALMDKLIDLFLIVVTYKVLSREADRYRASVNPLPSANR